MTSEVTAKPKLIERLGARYGVEPAKFLDTLKATVFRGNISNEQLMALLVVAEQYDLNPWTKEIYAFPDKGGGIVPVVGVDGWCRIINAHPQFDGMSFQEAPDPAGGSNSVPDWIECTLYRKDRSHATTAREYLIEVNRGTPPWVSHPRRMLRHKALIQTARLAFGFAGIYDPDEAELIVASQPRDQGPRPDTSQVDLTVRDKWVGMITDTLNADQDEYKIADALRSIDEELSKFPELYTLVLDFLVAHKIITKANWRKYLEVRAPAEQAIP
jgi:phage recombination protein Bet